jgi:PhzF family phenazine biosynthesis protein
MNVTVFLLNSFCIEGKGGNPAGVVLNAEGLSDEQKRTISAKVGYSETAFVEQSNVADFKVTFFTPSEEVDLCGHATIAVYTVLLQKGLCSVGRYTQELKVGILLVEVKGNGFILMDQTVPVFSEIIEPEELCMCVGYAGAQGELKLQIVSTGIRDILLPIDTLKNLNKLVINFEKLCELNKKTNTVGLHAFTIEPTEPGVIAYTRNFAPLYGIDEESATGSANGALACYLYTYKKLQDTEIRDMRFRQGYAMERPSEIFVSLEVSNTEIRRVQVGGTAIVVGEMLVEL